MFLLTNTPCDELTRDMKGRHMGLPLQRRFGIYADKDALCRTALDKDLRMNRDMSLFALREAANGTQKGGLPQRGRPPLVNALDVRALGICQITRSNHGYI